MNKIAQIKLYPDNGLKGLGDSPLANPGTGAGDGIGTFSNLLSTSIGLMTIIAVIWFVFTFIIGAIGIISAGGDKGSLESAKKKITTGLIGLIIVVIGMFVVDLIGFLLGFGAGGILNISNLFSLIQLK
jgi:hypothetical protein